MIGSNKSGGGGGSGAGQGGRRSGAGRGLGGKGAGTCICPGCGEKAPHRRGEPCYEMKCPKCGTAMIRES